MCHRTDDVVNGVVQALLALSRSSKRPAYGAIFLLNNVSYFRTQLLVERAAIAGAILSRPTQDLLNSNFRIAKAGYFDANFSPLLQTLIDEKDKGKSAVKEKFNRFFELLDEVTERHQVARVLVDDPDGRATVADEAVKLVVPSLQRFIQRNLGKEFSKSELASAPSECECLLTCSVVAPFRPSEVCVIIDAWRVSTGTLQGTNLDVLMLADIKMPPEDVENLIKGFYV